MNVMKPLLFVSLLFLCNSFCFSQTGTSGEPVRYIGGAIANPNVHDGALPYIIGAENIQVMRANHSHPDEADGFGWTYNHAPNLTYWNGMFYLQYLSNPKDEQQPPGQTLIVTSTDGRNWSKPIVAFPVYKAPKGVEIPKGYTGYIMHQRMGFYTAPDGRLLTAAFYGHSYNPFMQGGIGRVVREIRKDGSFGPIYFIRYSSHTDWNASNTTYPFYTSSKDKGFVAACKALLDDKLKTLQWVDEDRGLDGFYHLKDSINTVQALSYFHRKDGAVVALWKKSWAGLSFDNGETWSTPVKVPTLIMAGGKNWGQQTKDGRYAMVYNPMETQPYRYPLIAISSDDGILFDNMGVVHGEVPPRRFYGENKDFGPNYTRGITEGEQTPKDNNMWLTYSVNKEDIWVSRIPLPIRTSFLGEVNDNFDLLLPGAEVPDWNLYSPIWAKISVAEFPSAKNKSLRFEDEDPYDYARAIRVFQTAKRANVSFQFYAEKMENGTFQVDITDAHGARAVSLIFENGELKVNSGTKIQSISSFHLGEWNQISLCVDATGLGRYQLKLNGRDVLSNASFREAVKSVERISFRTGEYCNLPNRLTPNQVPCPPLKGCDEKAAKQIYYIDNVNISRNPDTFLSQPE